VRHGLNLVRLYAVLAQPIIPFAAQSIADCVGVKLPLDWPSMDAKTELTKLPAGAKVQSGEVLFKKIDDDMVAEWTVRFGGSEA
jgi:methionyl-tRNA synthetase